MNSSTRSRTANPASSASINYLTTLIGQRVAKDDDKALLDYIAGVQAAGLPLTQRLVSQAIDALKASPWKPRPVAASEMPPMVTTNEVDLSAVPAGKYGVPGSDTRLKVSIQKPTTGTWRGWTFVSDAAEYGYGRKYGSAKPGQHYRGDIVEALRTIAADPRAAMAEYGRLTNHCGRCGRKLEDEVSVAQGIGPVCITKMGW